MEQLQTFFHTKVSDGNLVARLYCSSEYTEDAQINEKEFYQFLLKNKIDFGIDQEMFQLVLTNPDKSLFPITIAKGTSPIHGVDGWVEYALNFSNEIVRTPDWNFRDVMKIPSVITGQKIATIHLPTKGQSGKSVFGKEIPAQSGKPVPIRYGKNVVFNKDDNSVYATTDGQISVANGAIQVHAIFEVNDSLSMKDGNLDFIGTIIIKGDVPTGYKVKAVGDIKIFGMVEAATIEAGGSIFISEGLAGMQKGFLKAEENIHIGYINQGNVNVGKDLYVENSILHSKCNVGSHVFCQRGSIIGGNLSIGKTAEAKDVGNRLNSKTEIAFGINKTLDDKAIQLKHKKDELEATLAKLIILGDKLNNENQQNPAIKKMLVKQRTSYKKTRAELKIIDQQLSLIDSKIGEIEEASLKVNRQLYPSVTISFGKYQRNIDSTHNYVQAKLEKNEIVIHSL